jgi:hypothetical protein
MVLPMFSERCYELCPVCVLGVPNVPSERGNLLKISILWTDYVVIDRQRAHNGVDQRDFKIRGFSSGQSELARELSNHAFCRKVIPIFGTRVIIPESGRVLELSIG